MPKKNQPAAAERIPCALDLPDGHYLENTGPAAPGWGFDVRGGEIHLSVASFAPMQEIMDKQRRVRDLLAMHNKWMADELAGLRKAERAWWDNIFDRLSIPRGVDVTVSTDGILTRMEEPAKPAQPAPQPAQPAPQPAAGGTTGGAAGGATAAE